MTEGPADRELVEAIASRGDEAAFRTLYRRHTPALYRIAVRLIGDRDQAAEDLVHDTWIRAADRFARFEWRSTLATWLAGILFNLVREARKEWARDRTVPLDGSEAEPATPPLDDRLDLERAVAGLAPGYRAVVVLHDIEGYTHEEVAATLGIDVGTSKSQLARARRRLRVWLVPQGRTA